MKTMLKIFGYLLAIIMTPLLLVIVLNLKDEPISPQAKALTEPRAASTLPPASNAYVSLMGIDAPVGQDINREGLRLISDYQAYHERWKKDPSLPYYEGENRKDSLLFKGKPKLLCPTPSLACLKTPLTPSKEKALETMLAQNQELIKRYETIISLPGYDSLIPMTMDSPLPNFSALRQTADLLVAQGVEAATQGDIAPLITQLQRDTRFWRRLLSRQPGLIESMVAVSSINSNLQWLSVLLADPSVDVDSQAAQIQEILKPLSPAESHLTAGLKNEFSSLLTDTLTLMRDVGINGKEMSLSRQRLASNLFYKPQASQNAMAESLSSWLALSTLSAKQWLSEKGKAISAKKGAYCLTRTYCLYNPIGQIMVQFAEPDYNVYIARLHDLNAYQHLVTIQYAYRSNPAAFQDVPKVLAQHKEWFNPYTEAPFKWDAQKRRLTLPLQGDWPDLRDTGHPERQVILPVMHN